MSTFQAYVAIAAFSEDLSKVVCLTKNRGPAHLVGKVNFPGGRLEDSDSSALDAALRELAEETGLQMDPSRTIGVCSQASDRHRLDVYAAVGDISGARTMESEVVFIADTKTLMEATRMPSTMKLYAADFRQILLRAFAKAQSELAPQAGQARLDSWATVALAPTSEPFALAPKGGVFRGMRDLDEATAYAGQVRDFFEASGAASPVFVIKGPTSTTREPFEVVDASCGYTVVHRAAPRRPVVADPARARLRP